MELVKFIAMELAEHETLKGQWPEGCDEVTHENNYELEFDGSQVLYVDYYGKERMVTVCLEIDGELQYLEEWDTGDTVTREEYEDFIQKNPTFYADLQSKRKENIAEIARLNKELAALVDKITTLAEEAGVGVTLDLGNVGDLNPNSDWDSSRC